MNTENKGMEGLQGLCTPYREPEDLTKLIEAIGESSIVLLGEATHGTSEFYRIRTELTKRLIAEKDFTFVAVEGDWPACYALNQYVRLVPGAPDRAEDALHAFNRWPAWMWANQEAAELVEWIRGFNEQLPDGERRGFYGLDVYSLWESLDEIIRYLENKNSPDLDLAKQAWECFEPHRKDEQSYAVSAAYFSETCRDEVVALLQAMRAGRETEGVDGESRLNAELNAMVAVHAEHYYRTMMGRDEESWNIRDRHMTEVLGKLLSYHGPNAKAVVWEHNTHIGDARATDMQQEGMVNVGQLAREQFGMDQVFAIGFGTYEGTVIAGSSWGAPEEIMKVPPAVKGSWEELLHRNGIGDQIIIFRGSDVREQLDEPMGHRAIGVVYHPGAERGNYVPSRMAERYDAFVYVQHSHALAPLHQIAIQAVPNTPL